MSFAERMRERREEMGISRSELASKLGVSRSAIGNYETGVSFPKEEVLLRLFDALQADPNLLYRDSYHKAKEQAVLSAAEQALVEKCRRLPTACRQAVFALVETLDQWPQAVDVPKTAPRLIPLYATPAAAGYASPAYGSDFTNIECNEKLAPNAVFAVRIQGDSMEPALHDGDIAYVSRDAMADGDIGIFCVDGDMLCKQYHRDALGIVYLHSLNRSRADADVVFRCDSGRSLICLGRVILPRRYPLPNDAE